MTVACDKKAMRLAIIALVIGGCSGTGRRQVEIGPPPMKLTKGTLAGATCDGDHCTCRQGPEDGGTGYPTDGRKRFEIKLESAYDLWATLPNTVLYKSPETATACFYVDLPPGKHPLTLRASNPHGVSFAIEVHELGTKTKAWYDTFAFACGHPGVCSFSELDDRKAEAAKVQRNLYDPCGSTKIKGLGWDHGKSPDQQYPSELQLELSLDIYEFAPWKQPGDPSCGEGGGRPPTDDDTGGDASDSAGSDAAGSGDAGSDVAPAPGGP